MSALVRGLSPGKTAGLMRLPQPAAEKVMASICAAFPRIADFQAGVSYPCTTVLSCCTAAQDASECSVYASQHRCWLCDHLKSLPMV